MTLKFKRVYVNRTKHSSEYFMQNVSMYISPANKKISKKTIPNVSYHHRKTVCVCNWNINEVLVNINVNGIYAKWWNIAAKTIAAAINLSFDILKVAFVFIHSWEYEFCFRHNRTVRIARVQSRSCISYTVNVRVVWNTEENRMHMHRIWMLMLSIYAETLTSRIFANR